MAMPAPTRLQQHNDKMQNQRKNKVRAVHAELQTATASHTHRIWLRAVIVLAVGILAYFYAKQQHGKEQKFAVVREEVPMRMQKFACSQSYAQEVQQFAQCAPKQCGRFVADKLLQLEELDLLLDLAERVIPKAGSLGGASILDIHTGALSFKDKFINVYSLPKLVDEIKAEHFQAYNAVKSKIKMAIAQQFGIDADSLYLTYPTFFSRITNVTAKTVHDEYWHEHVDKETYPSFHYTSLLYLNTHNKDFKGGRFLFVDDNANAALNRTLSAIEPKKGRVSAFSSGEENRHYVEKVIEGVRYAITISFSCNKKFGISDPNLKVIQQEH